MCLLLSCIAAVGVNIVAVAIIGRVSAVGYSVLGHFKTLLILMSDGVSFLDATKSIGIILALIGSAFYAEIKRKKRRLRTGMISAGKRAAEKCS